jgi:hypothetical protein
MIRQKFALLISKGIFADSEFPRFQRLSASIGRFSTSRAAAASPMWRLKRPPASATMCETGKNTVDPKQE